MTPNSVSVSTVVRTSPDTAFTLFTNDIDAWWRRASRHRSRPAASIVRFDDDSLVEVSSEGSTELGRVLAWEPGSRLVLAWLGPHWAPAERTVVEITFEPDGAGTRVTSNTAAGRRCRPEMQPRPSSAYGGATCSPATHSAPPAPPSNPLSGSPEPPARRRRRSGAPAWHSSTRECRVESRRR